MTKFIFLFSVSFLIFNSCGKKDSCGLTCYFEKLNQVIPYNKGVLFQTEPLDSGGSNIASINKEIESTLSSTGSKFRFDHYINTEEEPILNDSIRITAIGIAYYYYLKDWEFNGKKLYSECTKIQEYQFLKESNFINNQLDSLAKINNNKLSIGDTVNLQLLIHSTHLKEVYYFGGVVSDSTYFSHDILNLSGVILEKKGENNHSTNKDGSLFSLLFRIKVFDLSEENIYINGVNIGLNDTCEIHVWNYARIIE